MPAITKPSIVVTYNTDEIVSLIVSDLLENHGYAATRADVTPIWSGGYKSCDCDSWGGPRVGSCNCATIPAKFEGYKITLKQT